MLKLEPLDYLCRVYRFNSIRLAAESIPVAPSTISAALHKLEHDWEIKLLLRTYRGIELTEEAKQIAVRSERLFAEVEKVEREIEAIRTKGAAREKREKLTVLLPRGWWQGSVERFLPYMLEQGIDAEFPDILYENDKSLQFLEEHPNTVLIGYFVEPIEEKFSAWTNLCFYKVSTEKPCVLAAAHSQWIADDRKQISPEDAAKLPFLRFTQGYDQAFPILEMLEEYGKLRIIANLSSVQVLTAMLKMDQGVSVGCRRNLDREAEVRYIPIQTDMRLALTICWRQGLPQKYITAAQGMIKKFI